MESAIQLLACVGLSQILLFGKVLGKPRRWLRLWLYRKQVEFLQMHGIPFREETFKCPASDIAKWTRWDYWMELTECPMCAGFWLGLLIGQSFLFACASSFACFLGDSILDALETKP